MDHSILLDILRWDLVSRAVLFHGSSVAITVYPNRFSLVSLFQPKVRVPQGSCLGRLCFHAYASLLFKVVTRLCLMALVMQMLLNFLMIFDYWINLTSETNTVCAIQYCVLDIKKWMAVHRLKLNDLKTESLIFVSDRFLRKLSVKSIPEGIYCVSVARI